MRTVIYARFSSEHQNALSAADQIAMCRRRADREGWTIVGVFQDEAISGAAGIEEHQRPGLHAMLAMLKQGGVDQVLAESTDRVSRDIGDSHRVRKLIEYHGARLFTLFDGAVTPMIGLVKGFMDEQFRTDLAKRVRRGHIGAVRQGRSPGGLAFGYRKANQLDEKGELIRGLREIDPENAAIVRRIFTEYDAGKSAHAIASDLNREGRVSRRGGMWHATAIQGGPKLGLGMLRNPIYIGVMVYGRTRVVTDPETRRPLYRPGTDEPDRIDVPHMRIIDQDLWDRVQARLHAKPGVRPELQRRPKHPLSGLGICGVCGAQWVKIGGGIWGCAKYRYGGACDNNRNITQHRYEARVLEDLKSGLLAPDLVSEWVREYHRSFARQQATLGQDRAALEKRLAEAERKAARLLKAFAEGGSEFAEIRDMLTAAREEKERLGRELASMDAVPNILALHPHIESVYRQQVEELEAAISGTDARAEVIPRLRAMIGQIIVVPNPRLKRGVDLQVIRRMDQILSMVTDIGRVSNIR